MKNRFAILCSGQSGQHAGMFDIARENIESQRLLQSWPLEESCGYALDEILSDDRLLFSNLIAQPLLTAASLATWGAIRGFMPTPFLVAGYSVGELGAWSVAGAIAPEQTIRLAALRAKLLQSCRTQDRPQAMLGISWARTLSEPIERARVIETHGYFVAIEVDQDSVVVGGMQAEAASLESSITHLGGKITRLPIEIASHTPYMRSAVSPFRDALTTNCFQDPEFTVLAGITGARQTKGSAAPLTLSKQLAEPIRWHAVMDSLAEAGVTVTLELGPGSALSRMIKSRHPYIESRSTADFRSLEGIKKWVLQYSNA